MSVVEVGRFTFDPATGNVSGPADYMADADDGFPAWKARFESGRDVVFEAGAGGLSPSVEVALLVSVQTHYAGWRGARTLGPLS